MKTLVALLALSCLFLTACKAPQYAIGMPEADFLKHNNVQVVQQSANQSIYKKVNAPFGGVPITRFFYFRDGKLVSVDTGRQPDIIIDKTVHTN